MRTHPDDRTKQGSTPCRRTLASSALLGKTLYDRKRAEGKRDSQAVLALAQRRVNVLWAILRDRTTCAEPGLEPALAA
jgi:hypothetical protein